MALYTKARTCVYFKIESLCSIHLFLVYYAAVVICKWGKSNSLAVRIQKASFHKHLMWSEVFAGNGGGKDLGRRAHTVLGEDYSRPNGLVSNKSKALHLAKYFSIN